MFDLASKRHVERMIGYYFDVASRTARLSRAIRLKVGCVIVTKEGVMVPGYNGTPAGWYTNRCEYLIDSEGDVHSLDDHSDDEVRALVSNGSVIKTKDIVLHAETNALGKMAKLGISTEGCAVFLTHSPCVHCAKNLHQARVASAYYIHDYRSSDGVDFLRDTGINVVKYEPDRHTD